MTEPSAGETSPAGTGSAPAELSAELTAMLRRPLDPLLSDPVRLRLQATLVALPPEGSMTFTALRRLLEVSDGNLGSHLAVLVEQGYVEPEARYRGKRRTTWYSATPAGRAALAGHVRALQSVIEAAGLGETR